MDGSKPKILDGSALNPLVYSPDGRWVARFHFCNRSGSPKGFYASRVNARGELSGEPILLKAVTSDSDIFGRPMKWTTEGEIIILEVFSNDKTYTMSIETGESLPLSLHPRFLWQPEPIQWLSDGKHLCLPSGVNQQPGLLNVETGELTAVPISLPEEIELGDSAFSPNGKRIAFVQQKVQTDASRWKALREFYPSNHARVRRTAHTVSTRRFLCPQAALVARWTTNRIS